MNTTDELDWLAAQQPQGIEIDRGARERALTALTRHTSSRTGVRRFRLRSHLRLRTVGFAAATATAAAAIAAVLVLSIAGVGSGSGGRSHSALGAQAAVHHHATASPLARLANYVSASPAPAGDATLVARTTTGDGKTVTVYDLYADNGQYFFSPNEGGLSAQVSAHHDLADGLFAREIAAAKLAATGDVQTAAQDMADAPDPSHVISPTQKVDNAAIAAKLAALGEKRTAGGGSQSLFDNWVWEDSQDALIAGSGDPQVRAGVLRILATLPNVTVTNGTSAGQPTLVLTAGMSELGAGYTEQMTINADTGVPIQFVGGSAGEAPAATVDYTVSRVTLSSLPTGSGSGSSV